MPLNALLDIKLAVPDPDELIAFWVVLGLDLTAPGTLGTTERPSQLRVDAGDYRHVAEVVLACDSEDDLVVIMTNLATLGIDATVRDGVLRCRDPLADHEIRIEVADQAALTPPSSRQRNRPGSLERENRRSSVVMGGHGAVPRRVGHVVFGTPDVAASTRFYRDGLGLLVSDAITDGIGTFLRCTPDHHNIFLMPAPIPCMNHYALEMDDVDAIGLAGMKVVADNPEATVFGPGRHLIGSNQFWYLLDPAGGMFEFFSDMDQITDAERWDTEQRRDDWDPVIAAWQPAPPKDDFFLPSDWEAIAKARDAAGR